MGFKEQYICLEHFKEIRVAIVVDAMEEVNYRTCPDSEFMDRAEEQGNVWSLQGFQKYIEAGELFDFMQSVQHPNYMLVRFINMYENEQGVYCDPYGISNPTEEYMR